MNKRFSISTFLSVLIHFIILILFSEFMLTPNISRGAGDNTRLIGVFHLQQETEQPPKKKDVDSNVEPQKNEPVDNVISQEKKQNISPPKKQKVSPREEEEIKPKNTSILAKNYSEKLKYNKYLQSVLARIRAAKKYPSIARWRDLQGTAEVEIIVNLTGKIKSVGLLTSSGHTILDNEALDTVKRASPLSAFPARLNRKQLTLIIPIQFKLQ